ncbi:hypothetical protein HS088_TW06G01421 [Tripterygium wilfordii]|uniref:RNase H type-1 domain-containing protein n=1 Tax=Tripterygium wilfordii TaxID=458696 RepID=A0A7J7DLJ4_TRIWF|nr:hypothetical protein HS088_TW06G01421 [Tripterygium wilfordii]
MWLEREANVIGVGAVLPDHNGWVQAALSERIAGSFGPQIAESLAILKGLQLSVSSGFLNIIVESDAKSIVDAIASDGYAFVSFWTYCR